MCLFCRFYAHPGLSCSLKAQLTELNRLYGPGAALRPTVDKMVTPWAGVEASWTLTPGTTRLQCGVDGEEEVPGQLYLSPAPGEQFDLTVQLADQLLNYVSATIYVEVEHASVTTPPGVLIQLNGIQYAFTDRSAHWMCVCVCVCVCHVCVPSGTNRSLGF